MKAPQVLAASLAVVAVASAQKCGQRNSYPFLMNALQPKDSNYIVGGTQAIKNEFPWQVSIQFNIRTSLWSKTKHHICGGSIINDRWILTAAQCIHEYLRKSDYSIVAGAHFAMDKEDTTQARGVDRIIVHPGFDKQHLRNDIALMKLDRPLTMSPRSVAPICLPESSDPYEFSGKMCTVSGWGNLYQEGPASPALLKVDLPVVSNNLCEYRYNEVLPALINDDMVCAGDAHIDGTGTCQGDSGGPLVCEDDGAYFLVGVGSFNIICGSSRWPSVFTRVSSFRGWIDSNID